MSILLRPATPADVGSYIEVAKSVESETYVATTDPAAVYKEIMSSDVLMVENDGVVVGILSYVKITPHLAHITEVAIHREHARRGFGKEALRQLLDRLIRDRFVTFYLETHRDNTASKGLYIKSGFRVSGFDNDYKGTGRTYDVLTFGV